MHLGSLRSTAANKVTGLARRLVICEILTLVSSLPLGRARRPGGCRAPHLGEAAEVCGRRCAVRPIAQIRPLFTFVCMVPWARLRRVLLACNPLTQAHIEGLPACSTETIHMCGMHEPKYTRPALNCPQGDALGA